MDAKKLKDECIPSVLFLYGCESMAMKIEGQTEALTAKKLLELSYWYVFGIFSLCAHKS